MLSSKDDCGPSIYKHPTSEEGVGRAGVCVAKWGAECFCFFEWWSGAFFFFFVLRWDGVVRYGWIDSRL